MEQLERIYDLLREEVWVQETPWERISIAASSPQHPLHALWSHQDSAGVEDGLTVACIGGKVNTEYGSHFWASPTVYERDVRMPCISCQGSGRVLRDTSDWPESAVNGWVVGLMNLCPDSWKPIDATAYIANPTSAMLNALEAAVRQELVPA